MSDLVLLSGGMDSSTLLGVAHGPHRDGVGLAVAVAYGQRHTKELGAAVEVAKHYGVPIELLDLTGWGKLLKGSALTDPNIAVPLGHYADPSMALTIVPNRNATMLMAAAGIAQSIGCSRVLTAVHAGDHPVYPDCRPDFIDAASQAAFLASDGKITIEAPFVNISKADIALMGAKIGVPYRLTWSCYLGGEEHCGKCGTCVERIEAFAEAHLIDPTTYVVNA